MLNTYKLLLRSPNEGVMKVSEMHYTSHMTRHKHCYEPRDSNRPPGSGTRPLGVTCYMLLVTRCNASLAVTRPSLLSRGALITPTMLGTLEPEPQFNKCK